MALRSGIITGIKTGILSGIEANFFVGQDGSSIYLPLAAADFSALSLAAPDFLWPCQETSSHLVSTIGSLTLLSQGAGTHLYQQTVSGWTRKAIGSQDDNTVCAWRLTSGGPSPVAGSVAWCGYFSFPSAPAAVRTFLNIASTPPQFIARINANGTITININAVEATGTYNYVDGAVHPIALVYDKTAGTAKCFTDKEVITGTYVSTVTDSNKGIGGVSANATCIYRTLWLTAYTSSNAERDWKAQFQRLNWPLSY